MVVVRGYYYYSDQVGVIVLSHGSRNETEKTLILFLLFTVCTHCCRLTEQ